VDRARDSRSRSRSALAARLRRWLRPPRTLRPTRAGWTFFALTFGVGFAALNTGNNLLYLVLSLMLAFLVLSGVLSESALRGIALRRRIPCELHDGGVHPVVLEVSNLQRRVPAFAVVVEDHVRERGGVERPAGRVFALRIGPGQTESRAYRLRPTRRGEIELCRFRVSTRFPFGLFAKAMEIEAPEPGLVYPAIEAVEAPATLGSARGAGERVLGPRGVGSDVGGLRDFSPGDPLRRIHWRATLRQRELLVREIESEQDAEVELRLRTAATSPGEEFERRVRWVASEAAALLGAGFTVALRTDHAYVPPAGGERQRAVLLAFLARVEPGAPARVEAA
jgi:uncharacterized protein (DUF58 family)